MTFDGRKGNTWLSDERPVSTSYFVSDVNKRTLARIFKQMTNHSKIALTVEYTLDGDIFKGSLFVLIGLYMHTQTSGFMFVNLC